MTEINRRDLARGGALLALGATLGGCATDGPSLADHPPWPNIDPMSMVHPELRAAAKVMYATQAKGWSAEALREAREKEKPGPRLPDVPVDEKLIKGAGIAPDVRIYIVNAKPGTSRPGILYMHGGGFILGSAAADLAFLQLFVKDLDCTIVSVEYRLAPETRWKGSVEDNYAGLKWLHDHADELGVDRTKLAVMGGSAGGGHAALLAIAARDRGEVNLAFQSLTYPMLDDRTASTRPVPDYIGHILWTPESNRFGWYSFLGGAPGGKNIPAAAVPARNANLAGLPPTWIGVGGIDLFVEEDIDYARALVDAGVPTELIVVPGAFHGFDFVPGAKISQQFALARLNALRRAFGLDAS